MLSLLNQKLPSGLDNTKPIKYLVLSDVHLGHKRTTTKEIVKNLTKFFSDFKGSSKLEDIDILFLAGDLFDQAMWFTSEDVTHTILFVRRLLHWCAEHQIKFRMLEGTKSHDRGQFKNLVPIAETIPNLDFRYIETVCVESFIDLNLTCLYVPDEFSGSAKETETYIDDLLNSIQIDKVDIAIMHGMFKYQVPEVASDRFKFDEAFFLDKVRYFINIGHVHIHSTYERILAQGSFDRLCHNEEHPKGGMLMEIDRLKGNQFWFLENTDAKSYVTCHVRFKDIEKAIYKVRSLASKLRDGSYLRIKAAKGHEIFNVFDSLAREYPCLVFTKISEEDEKERQQLIDTAEIFSLDYTPIHLDQNNLVPLIVTEVKAKYDFSPSLIERLENKLKELI